MKHGGAEATWSSRRLGGLDEAWRVVQLIWRRGFHKSAGSRKAPRASRKLLVFAVLSLATAGCRGLPPLPAANLKEPGWKIQQGQAIWRSGRAAPEVAGEVLLATRMNGEAFIQFTKTPFPLVLAQRTADAWQIEIPTQNKRYTGRGRPPARLIWFLLAQILCGEPAPANWSWRQAPDNWRLENTDTGESLEGFFANNTSTQTGTP